MFVFMLYTLFLFEHVHIYNRTNAEKVTCYFSQSSICRQLWFSVNHVSACLMGGEDEHLGYLDVFRLGGGIECNVCSCDQCNSFHTVDFI